MLYALKKVIAGSMILSAAGFAMGQDTPPARPAVAFPPTPTPAPQEPPMTDERLDAHLIPSQFLARTSDVLCIVYNGFRRSQIDPCGCVSQQLGGLDKEARLVKRIDEHKIPAIQVDAGGFVRDLPEANMIAQSKALLKGLGSMGYDAVNVAFTDLALTPDDLKQTAEDAGVKLVSANITDQAGSPVFEPFVIQEVSLANGSTIKVGILGVTRTRVEMSAQPLDAPTTVTAAGVNLQITDPATAINKYASELKGKADLVVALVYDRRINAENIIKSLTDKSLVDVLVTGENSQIQGSVQALEGIQVVSGGYEGRQMGTLYVELKDNEVVSTWNRHIDILQSIPPVPAVTAIMEEAKGSSDQPGVPTPAAAPTKLEL